MKKIIAAFAAIALVGFGVSAANADPKTCTDTTTVVVSQAFNETIHHDAVTHIVHHDAVTHTETVPDQRFSWTPKGPVDESQEGPSDGSTPLTDPDHWQGNTHHYNGTDPVGEVFQQGKGNGGNNASWFFWTTKTNTVVDEPAFNETVTDSGAFNETIHHDAVTKNVVKEVPCNDTPDTPTTPNTPDEPKVDKSDVRKVTSVQKSHKATVEVPTEIESGL